LKKAVVTNAPGENVKFVLEVLKLGDSFDAVVLAEEAIAGKPDPASYQLVLSQLGISPKDAIALEDSPSGIQAAVGAGIYTIGVASTHEPKDLLEAGAAMVIPAFTEHQLWLLLDSFMEQNSSV
jgi:beta-phosphoglucomutase